jgi:predicted RND superfamily exporter protein
MKRLLPVLPLLAVLILLGSLALVPGLVDAFRIDSSTDTMVLEEDPESLRYDRNALVFSNDEFVLVGVTRDDLFSPEGIAAVEALHTRFAAIDKVREVWSIARPPAVLLRSFKTETSLFAALGKQATVTSPEIDIDKAKDELTQHELFAKNLVSADGRTAGIIVTLRYRERSKKALQTKLRLFDQRGLAREALAAATTDEERAAATSSFNAAQAELDAFWSEWVESEKERKDERIAVIQRVREIVAEERAKGQEIGLSGVPAIVVEMVEAISSDLRIFLGLSALFVFVFLLVVFRRLRWTILPLIATGTTIVLTLACMYAVDKQITVITGNVPSLLLVIGLAHSIHLVVRYRELLQRHPEWDKKELAAATAKGLVWPCLFTAMTTAAGFVSLYYAGSRPIIDFGFLMAGGVGLAFLLSFVFLPAGMALLPIRDEGKLEGSSRRLTSLARLSLSKRPAVLALTLVIMVLSVWGISRIEVEARFIDYFSPSSPIHEGLTFIDRRLGGTAGMEIVISSEKGGAFGPSNPQNLDKAAEVVAWLEAREEIGAVMSFVGMIDEARKALPAWGRGQAAMALGMNFSPDMLSPYVVTKKATVAGQEVLPFSRVRITARVKETQPNLKRAELLADIRAFLAKTFPDDPPEGQPKLKAEVTGMFVLYANMLASLAGSQVRTSLLALGAIWLMLAFLFRNPFAAFLGVIPNLVPITFVLGSMGWAGIPLDMATVMIASVSLGIGVDCAIHYLFRYREEVALDGDVAAAIERSHASIGTSILFTSLVSVVGFTVLVFSAFRPNAYFGLFTGFAMVAALFAMLTLLPVLIALTNPFAKTQRAGLARAKSGGEASPPAEAEPPTEPPSAPTDEA